MTRRIVSVLALIVGLGLFSGLWSQDHELRGVWVTPRDGSSLWTKGRIGAVMDSIAHSGFNTVYFNAWSRGFPLWQSEVFEAETGYRIDPLAGSRDILEEAIIEAHRAGLEIEAWMEYGYVAYWSGYNPTGIPKGPLFSAHPDWLARDGQGNDQFALGGGLGYFHWMSHSHPAVHNFMVALHAEIAKKYDIDGIELDRIRYPNLNCGYDSVSVERYKADHGGTEPPVATNDPEWMRWRADIINEFHAAVYDSIKAANSHVIVSNAPSHYASGPSYPAYDSFLQDWKAWVNNGDVDAVQVQMYVSPLLLQGYIPSALSGVNDPSKVMAGIAAVSSGTIYPLSDLLAMISVVRTAGLQGHSIWYYNDLESLGYLGSLKAQAYSSEAIPPWRGTVWRPRGLFFDESNTDRTGSWIGANFSGARGGFFYYADTLNPAQLAFRGSVPNDGWYIVCANFFTGLANLATAARYLLMSGGVPSETTVVSQAALSQPVTAGWCRLGDVYLQSGSSETLFTVSNAAIGSGRYLMVDDVMLLLNRKLSPDVVLGLRGAEGLEPIPEVASLTQNYPNPFNGVTTLRYSLPASMEMSLEVYDSLGRRIWVIAEGRQGAGTYAAHFDSNALPSGVYFARLRTPGATVTQKMVLLR